MIIHGNSLEALVETQPNSIDCHTINPPYLYDVSGGKPTYYVYALVDTMRETAFYIGITKWLGSRFANHLKANDGGIPKNDRIKDIQSRGGTIGMWVLYETKDRIMALQIESILVAAMSDFDCVNVMPGPNLKGGRTLGLAEKIISVVGWSHFMNIDLRVLEQSLVPEETLLPDAGEPEWPSTQQRYYEMPIEDLDFTIRVFNCLKRAGVMNVGMVLEKLEKGDDEVLAIRNLGPESLDELKQTLRDWLNEYRSVFSLE